MLRWPNKDPQEKLDHDIDWSKCLDNDDTISGSTWEMDVLADSALVLEDDPAPTFNDTATKVWLSGGTDGQRYRLVNTITTAAGRVLQESVILECKSS